MEVEVEGGALGKSAKPTRLCFALPLPKYPPIPSFHRRSSGMGPRRPLAPITLGPTKAPGALWSICKEPLIVCLSSKATGIFRR